MTTGVPNEALLRKAERPSGLVARAAAMGVRFAIEGDEVAVTATPTEAGTGLPGAPAPSVEDERPSDSAPPDTQLA